jgi:hypothetical protein
MYIELPSQLFARARGEWRVRLDACDGADPAPGLQATLADALAQQRAEAPRRLGNFARLALVGALACRAELAARSIALPHDCALLLISNSSVWQEISPGIAGLNANDLAPTPFEFLAVQGNSACLAIAKCVGIGGAALCCSDDEDSRKLLLSALALDAPALLVGRVERGPQEWSSEWVYYSALRRLV